MTVPTTLDEVIALAGGAEQRAGASATGGAEPPAGGTVTGGAELRAGGTDLAARRRCGLAAGPFVDLSGVTELRGITWSPDGAVRIGAMTTVADIAVDARMASAQPALAATAAALATPQVRAGGTLGGNLLQRNRCSYYRSPQFSCHQSGGDGCPSRAGIDLYATVIDRGPCIAPHPSSLAMALLASEAKVAVHPRGELPVADLYGDGSDPTRDHLLAPGEVLLAVDLGPPVPGERAAYHRAVGRAEGEWPLVEAVARLAVTGETITFAAVAAGGVARTPVRLTAVEAELTGRPATAQTLRAAAERASDGCTPLRQNGYKLELLRATTLEVLERAAAI
jgi:xanthine dehydrogenase YagS FAD-binding subunit